MTQHLPTTIKDRGVKDQTRGPKQVHKRSKFKAPNNQIICENDKENCDFSKHLRAADER